MKPTKATGRVWFALSAVLSLLIVSGFACSKHHSISAQKNERLAWGLKTTVEAYNHAGFANDAWNDAARAALTEFARMRANDIASNEPANEIISTNVAAAVSAGCNDPMVNYLFIKYSMSQTNSKEAFVAAFCKTAGEMNSSSYPPIRKFYAAARALDQIFYTFGTNSANTAEESEVVPILNQSQNDVLIDASAPSGEAYDVAELALSLMRGDTAYYDQDYKALETPLFKNWPDAASTWIFKGNYYIDLAWRARGSGFANEVTPEGWKGFADNLSVAQDALEHAWKLDPRDTRIPEIMITVVLGQNGGRDRMEMWFNRAMAVDPNDYSICLKKLFFLEPKWYGSDEDQLAFGRECVQSTKWGGQVPLTLVDAHRYINARNDQAAQADYWKQPQVWADVQTAYERYFELNPRGTDIYKNYAWYAYHAEQWDKLNELIPKIDPNGYSYFGSREDFDKMVQQANAHGGSIHPVEAK